MYQPLKGIGLTETSLKFMKHRKSRKMPLKLPEVFSVESSLKRSSIVMGITHAQIYIANYWQHVPKKS